MIAHSMNDLERMLRKEVKEAMRQTSGNMFRDMYEETQDFYSQGNPHFYEMVICLEICMKKRKISTHKAILISMKEPAH